MTAPARFRMGDVQRAINAAKKCGYQDVRVTVSPDGSIEITVGNGATDSRANPLDRLLGNGT